MVNTGAKPSLGGIFQAGLLAAAGSAVANAALYFIGNALGFFPATVITPMGQPITVVNVLLLSVVSSLGATVVYAALSRFLRNPNPAFLGLAALVFLLMFFGPFSLQGAPAGMVWTLQLMHVVAAAFPIYLLTRLGR